MKWLCFEYDGTETKLREEFDLKGEASAWLQNRARLWSDAASPLPVEVTDEGNLVVTVGPTRVYLVKGVDLRPMLRLAH